MCKAIFQNLKKGTSQNMKIILGACTDPGLQRKENDDSYGIWLLDKEGSNRLSICLAVADGVGGYDFGNRASEIAVKEIKGRIGQFKDLESDIEQQLKHMVMEINDHIYDIKVEEELDSNSMSTTLTVAVLMEDRGYFANVGNSRIYYIRGNRIIQLTTDQTWVEKAIAKGWIKKEEASTHPNKQIITQSVGFKKTVEITSGQFSIEPKDRLVLCTDGLFDVVSQSKIKQVVKKGRDLQSISEKLVTCANEKGGPDNITVITAFIYNKHFTLKEWNPFSRNKRKIKVIKDGTLDLYDEEVLKKISKQKTTFNPEKS